MRMVNAWKVSEVIQSLLLREYEKENYEAREKIRMRKELGF